MNETLNLCIRDCWRYRTKIRSNFAETRLKKYFFRPETPELDALISLLGKDVIKIAVKHGETLVRISDSPTVELF